MRSKLNTLEIEKAICARSFSEFVKRAWHVIEPATPLVWGWAMDAVCNHLEAVERGDFNRLLINIPPGFSKSLLTSVFWNAWVWGPRGRKDQRFLSTSHSMDLAMRDTVKCRTLIESEWYQYRWPIDLKRDQNAKGNFANTSEGFRKCAAFTKMTGHRGDCLLAGTEILTKEGIKTIEDIVNSSYTSEVLSYDTHSERLVYRRIEAVARRSSLDFYRIHTTGGRLVECTGDHRIYTKRGYVEARLLSCDDVLLQTMWGGGSSKRLPDEEVCEKRTHECDVQRKMRSNIHKHRIGKTGKLLQKLQLEMPKRSKLLQSRMQRQEAVIGNAEKAIFAPKKRMRGLQKRVFSTLELREVPAKILFDKMQRRCSRTHHGGIEQPRLAKRRRQKTLPKWDTSCVLSCKRGSHEARRGEVCGLFKSKTITLPPHRPQFRKQRCAEFSDALSSVPHEASRAREVETWWESVSLVERVCEGREVFDIQVEGTRCFFASGILVHNCVILDDPLAAGDADSEKELENSERAFLETLPTRVNSEASAIVVIMQRLHERDVSGLILEKNLPYVHLCLPMRFEADRKCVTPIFEDPRTEEGELLFPEFFSEPRTSALEKVLGSYGTAGQLQQRPTPRDGGDFSRTWFKIVDSAPYNLTTVRAWDFAASEGKGDWTVGAKMGRDQEGRFYILDIDRFRKSNADVETSVVQHAHLDGFVCPVSIPKDPGQAGKGQAEYLVKQLAGYIVDATPETGDKRTRAKALATQAQFGNVYIVKADWNEDFLREVETFPSGKHDDQVDACSRAFNYLAVNATASMDEITDMLYNRY